MGVCNPLSGACCPELQIIFRNSFIFRFKQGLSGPVCLLHFSYQDLKPKNKMFDRAIHTSFRRCTHLRTCHTCSEPVHLLQERAVTALDEHKALAAHSSKAKAQSWAAVQRNLEEGGLSDLHAMEDAESLLQRAR